jgi:hypothetical protein
VAGVSHPLIHIELGPDWMGDSWRVKGRIWSTVVPLSLLSEPGLRSAGCGTPGSAWRCVGSSLGTSEGSSPSRWTEVETMTQSHLSKYCCTTAKASTLKKLTWYNVKFDNIQEHSVTTFC